MLHALIIGGTGMLRDVSIWLNHNGYSTTVMARGKQKLKQLGYQFKSDFDIISLDYENTIELKNMTKRTIQKYGRINLIVAWIHSHAPHALPAVLSTIEENQKDSFDLYEIKGSSSYLEEIKSLSLVPPNCNYHQIQLGFIIEKNNQSRWLTHKEIADGVIYAINNHESKYKIGQLEPWDKRP